MYANVYKCMRTHTAHILSVDLLLLLACQLISKSCKCGLQLVPVPGAQTPPCSGDYLKKRDEKKKGKKHTQTFVFYTHPRNTKTNDVKDVNGKEKKGKKRKKWNIVNGNGCISNSCLLYTKRDDNRITIVYWPRIGFDTQDVGSTDICVFTVSRVILQ